MTTRVVTTTEDEFVLAVAEKMNAGHFRHVPVLKEGRLAGIISIGDIVKYRLAEMEDEQSAMREYINLGQIPISTNAASGSREV